MEIIKLNLESLLWILFPTILVLVGALLLQYFRGMRKPEKGLGRYSLRQAVLSKAEADFFVQLKNVVGGSYLVFPKIRLADIFDTKNGQGYYAALNKITAKHIDFLLCDPVTFSPILAIELDGKSHNKQIRKERDQFVDHLFHSLQLPLLRIRVSRSYKAEVIREGILESLKSKQG